MGYVESGATSHVRRMVARQATEKELIFASVHGLNKSDKPLFSQLCVQLVSKFAVSAGRAAVIGGDFNTNISNSFDRNNISPAWNSVVIPTHVHSCRRPYYVDWILCCNVGVSVPFNGHLVKAAPIYRKENPNGSWLLPSASPAWIEAYNLHPEDDNIAKMVGAHLKVPMSITPFPPINGLFSLWWHLGTPSIEEYQEMLRASPSDGDLFDLWCQQETLHHELYAKILRTGLYGARAIDPRTLNEDVFGPKVFNHEVCVIFKLNVRPY